MNPSRKTSLARFLLQESRSGIIIISVIGFVSGACGAGLVALINSALYDNRSVVLAAGFLMLVSGKIGASALSQRLLYRSTQRAIWAMSLSLSREFAHSSLRKAEQLGAPRTLAVLVEDVQVLAAAVQSVPSLVVNIAILIGCSLYLAWLSWLAFATLGVLAILGVLIYRLMLKKTQASLKNVREKRDLLFGHFRALTEGIKELRLNRDRRDDLFQNHIARTIEDLEAHGTIAIRQHIWTDALSQSVFYAILGLLLFGLPLLGSLPIATLTGYVFAALYLMGPLWGVIYALPTLQRGQIALEKIEDFRTSLSAEPEFTAVARDFRDRWQTLQLRDVVFSYEDGAEKGFVLGPIDFELKRGEVVFVIGGNGCGKSTFVKLLCGLYTPQSGSIVVDGQPVGNNDRDAYRQYFSVVFSDFFLFDTVLGNWNEFQESRIRRYLSQLQLDKKVTVNDRRFSTTALSQGQRRRLALLSAYLEDRPIYVFDEWAADQDPAYKEVFYKSLLPELRGQGKAVVVITHDDRYFSSGDRVVTLDYGRIVRSDVPAVPVLG